MTNLSGVKTEELIQEIELRLPGFTIVRRSRSEAVPTRRDQLGPSQRNQLGSSQRKALEALVGVETMTSSELAQTIQTGKTNIYQTMIGLERRGLVECINLPFEPIRWKAVQKT